MDKREYFFDPKTLKTKLVNWIKAWFEENGKNCNAVIGISGGIDSSVAAALCVEALGHWRVIGVMMPGSNSESAKSDIDYGNILINHLNIKSYTVSIEEAVKSIIYNIAELRCGRVTLHTEINLPPRVRMATLYAVSQSNNGRVINTSNLSESYVGYDTRYGDSVGDVSPLGQLTKTEIRMLAKELGLPDVLVNKVSADGLCGMTDEERFGFSYDILDKYIITGNIDDEDAKRKIDSMHKKNLFKLHGMPVLNRCEI